MENALRELIAIVTSIALTALLGVLVIAIRQLATEGVKNFRQQNQLLLARLSTEQREAYDWVVRNVVKAVEQSGLIGEIQKVGAEKKALAISLIRDWITRLHLPDLNADAIGDLIESAIRDGVQNGLAAFSYEYSELKEPAGLNEVAALLAEQLAILKAGQISDPVDSTTKPLNPNYGNL